MEIAASLDNFSFFDYVNDISEFKLSNDQTSVVSSFELFLRPSENKKIFILSGYAGTGKSTLTSLLNRGVKKTGAKTRLLAPTGRAAKVLALFCSQKAHTIHKEIYFGGSQLEEIKKLAPVKNIHKNTIFLHTYRNYHQYWYSFLVCLSSVCRNCLLCTYISVACHSSLLT